MRRRTSTGTVAALAALLATSVAAAPAGAAPKPAGPAGPAAFIGKPATAKPIRGIPRTRPEPVHGAERQRAAPTTTRGRPTPTRAGPARPQARQTSNDFTGDCVSTSFDRKGRMVAVCVDPRSADAVHVRSRTRSTTLAKFDLPPRRRTPAGISPLKDTGGGAYFYMDNKDRIWNGTTTRHVQVISEKGDGLQARPRLRPHQGAQASDERITSVLPDWSGKIWFVARARRRRRPARPQDRQDERAAARNGGLEDEIENSFAVGEDGAVMSPPTARWCRCASAAAMKPKIVWQRATRRSRASPSPASSTTAPARRPTLHAGRLRRDHRQRRPDERRRVPHGGEAEWPRARSAARSARSPCSARARAPPRTR